MWEAKFGPGVTDKKLSAQAPLGNDDILYVCQSEFQFPINVPRKAAEGGPAPTREIWKKLPSSWLQPGAAMILQPFGD